MAFTGKSLADGTVANTQTAIYTVPASTVAYISGISLYCNTATPQTVAMYVKRSGGTARLIAHYIFSQQHDHVPNVLDDRLVLAAGDAVEAITTTAAVVPYVVTGVEEA